MWRQLIRSTATIFVALPTLLFSQTPVQIQAPGKVLPQPVLLGQTPDLVCNEAGTFKLGAFVGQSNDTDLATALDTIFLCLGDKIDLNHDGNYDLSGDPQPASLAGVTYAFYNCKPTIGGMTLAQVKTDPCLNTGGITPPTQGIWVSDMTNLTEAQGDQTFSNNGSLQSFFAIAGNVIPLLQWYAPITVDDWVAPGYEQVNMLSPIGPCVDVSPNVAFPVVYLNELKVTNVLTNLSGNGCRGRFHLEGGYSEFIDLQMKKSLYDIKVTGPGVATLSTNPDVVRHGGQDPVFMFSQPGIYAVSVEDGKSCGATFTMDMSGCNPASNVDFEIGDQNFAVGETVCVPFTVDNFVNIAAAQGTVSWCPQDFAFSFPVQSGVFGSSANYFSGQAASEGLLTFNWFDQTFIGQTYPNGTVAFSVCLTAIGTAGDICPINVTSQLSPISVSDATGYPLAVNINGGSLTIGQVDIAQVNITSNCTSAGAFEVTATGTGTPGYSLAYKNITFNTPTQTATFSNSFTVSNLSGGEYGVTVTDAAGVMYDTVITIYSIVANLQTVNPSCFGLKDGSAKTIITVNGSVIVPTADFSFAWNPSNGPNNPNWLDIGSGPYSVTVTNSQNGCTAVAAGGLNTASQILITNLNKTEATCSGVPNGALSFNIIGGTPSYSITFDNGLNSASGANYSNNAISSGIYKITITDTDGCKRFDSVEIEALKTYELTETQTNVACFGQNSGSISVIFSTDVGSPSAPLSFVWSNGTVSNAGFSSTAANLSAGTVNLVAKDATGCGVTANYLVTSPSVLASNISKIDPSCSIPTSGSACALMTSGGVLPYDFLWDNGGTTACINNLLSGTYSVTVTDNNGCTVTNSTTLSIPPSPIINSVDSTSLNCFDSQNGSLTVNAVAGSPGSNIVSYQWTNGSNTKTANNLACGNQNVTITDNNGCKTTGAYQLACPPQLIFVDTTITKPTCPADDNGSICVVVNGGIGAYNYTWVAPTAPSNPCLINQKAGIYKLTVKDAKGCTLLGNFEIKDPVSFTANFDNLTAASCAGTTNCNGAVDVTASYPNGQNATFTYQWLEANIFVQNPITLCPGTNTVKITDNSTGCLIEAAIVISAPPLLEITDLAPTQTTCNSICDGSANAQVVGGVAPYLYDWSNGQTNNPAISLCAGVIVVTVTDANDCEAVRIFEVVEPDPVEVVFDPIISSDVTCFGAQNGVVGWLVSGGNGGFSWNWLPNVGSTQVVTNLNAGQYKVTATDALGCTGTGLANLQQNPPIQANFDPYTPINCFGESTNLSVDTVVGGVGPYNYEIDFGPTTPSTLDTRIDGGAHIAIFIDQADCRDTVKFTIIQPEEIGLDLGPDLRIELGDTTQQIFTQIKTNTQVDSFIWTPTIGLSTALDLRPFVNSIESQLYTLTIFDPNGCSGTDEVFVEIDPNRKVFIPNVFKPGTTLSDHFRVFVGNGVKSINYMRIFDRWGELIFEQENFYPQNSDYAEGWDGSFRGKKMGTGVYIYMVEVAFLDGRTLLYRGDVTLVRDKN